MDVETRVVDIERTLEVAVMIDATVVLPSLVGIPGMELVLTLGSHKDVASLELGSGGEG